MYNCSCWIAVLFVRRPKLIYTADVDDESAPPKSTRKQLTEKKTSTDRERLENRTQTITEQ